MKKVDVIIVGAGMAGLTAAGRLEELGLTTVVLDKGRAPGGRMATRTIDSARFDHGAQHFSVRSPQFREQTAQWMRIGVVNEWFRAASLTVADRRIEARHIGAGGMRSIPEHLAASLRVETSTTIDRIDLAPAGVAAVATSGEVWNAAGVVLTPPVPQTQLLLGRGNVELSSSVEEMLDTVVYDPCLAVMAHLDTAAGLPDGHLTPRRGPIAWMADNQHKGISASPAVTIHSSPEYAIARLDADSATWVAEMTDAAQSHLAGSIIHATGHRWRYSRPVQTFDVGAVAAGPGVPVVLGGEVFAGARVEGAFLSGLAAADQLWGVL
jgi:predicted NAD/FAD-dependent oxidoreductase